MMGRKMSRDIPWRKWWTNKFADSYRGQFNSEFNFTSEMSRWKLAPFNVARNPQITFVIKS
jgi:hypothetical protein